MTKCFCDCCGEEIIDNECRFLRIEYSRARGESLFLCSECLDLFENMIKTFQRNNGESEDKKNGKRKK